MSTPEPALPDLSADAFARAILDETVAPFAAPLDAAELGWARDQLAALLADDPHAAALFRAAFPRAVDHSGERTCGEQPGPKS